MISIYKRLLWVMLFINFIALLQIASSQTLEWKWAQVLPTQFSEAVDFEDSGMNITLDKQNNIYCIIKNIGYFKNFRSDPYTGVSQHLQKYTPNGKLDWYYGYTISNDHKKGAVLLGDSLYIIQSYWAIFLSANGYNREQYWNKMLFPYQAVSIQNAWLDRKQNIIMTGTFLGAKFFSEQDTLPNNGFGDIFLVKYSRHGEKLWTLTAGGNDADKATSVTTDNDGNIYLAGTFYSDSISFGNILLKREKGNDLFLVKFDENGTPLWAKTWGSLGTNNIAGVCIDTAGNVIIAGNFLSSAITFDSNYAVNRNTGTSDIFLLKINAQGDFLWQSTFGGKDNDRVNALRSDHLGNLYLTGFFSSPEFECTNTTLLNSGGRDIFVIKLSSDNRLLYIESIGGAKNDEGADIGVDSTGSIILTGCFSSPIVHFGKFPLKTTFKSSAFLAKLSERITNIEEASPNSLLKIFPNPTKSTFHISGIEGSNWNITIYSLTGEKIYESLLKDSRMIDLSGRAKGMYVYQLQKDGEVLKTGKLVVE